MKKLQLLFVWLTIILFMLPAIRTIGQSGTDYNMRIANAAQVSCNVYEFDVFMSSTTANLVRLANFQIGIRVNPAIIPVGASVNASIVPGSSTMPVGMRPGAEKFFFDNQTYSFQVAPNTPIGIGATDNLVPQGAGWKLFRARVACTEPFAVGANTNHQWNFDMIVSYPTRVFAYLSGLNTVITNPSFHSLAASPNVTLVGGYPDPIAQTLSTDQTEFCNLPGTGATITLGSTQTGYTYYLYSDGIRVQGSPGIVYGNGLSQSFSAKATGNIMSVMSVGCTGLIPMANTIALSPAPPVNVTLSLTAFPGTIILPNTSVTFTANSTNEGDDPFYSWFINGDQDWNVFENQYEYIPAHGDQIQVVLSPSAEVCTQDLEVYSNILTIWINEMFNVTGGGTFCETSLSTVHLSGSKTGIVYTLLKDGIQYGAPKSGTGQPLFWYVFDAGVYTVSASGLMMNGSAQTFMNPLPEVPGPISGLAYVRKGTLNVPYSVSPVAHADSLIWDYTGTGVVITATGMNSVSVDFALNATAGLLSVRGFNDNCGYNDLSYLQIYTCEDQSTNTSLTICSDQLPFEWETYTGANAITAAGNYQVVYPTTNPPGCDSTIYLTLTVISSTSDTTTVSDACDSYIWSVNGETYTASGTYTHVVGCHTEILQLTVTPSSDFTTIDSACDLYVWTVNGQTYTESGVYTHVTGCHTEILELTIIPGTSFTTIDSACDSYVWVVNGQTYTESGVYTHVTGCHTEILQLTVNNSYYQAECDAASIYDYQTYEWQGLTLNTSGLHTVTLQTIHGCDSVLCLNLIVKSYIPVKITKNIGRAVQVEWLPVSGASIYRLKYRQIDPPLAPPFDGWITYNQSTQLLRKLLPLEPGYTYELFLEYRTGTTWLPAYSTIEFTTNVVTFESTYDIGNKFIISWTALDSDDYSVSSYILQYRKSPSTSWITRGYYPSNSAVMGSMEEGALYEYRVCPRYDEVSFDWTKEVGVLSNFIDISVANYNGTSADFSWDPVVNPVASDYYLQIRKLGETAIFSSNYTASASRTVTGLNAGDSYEYRLVVRYSNVAWGATGWRLLAGSKEENLVILPQNNLNVYPNPVSDLMTVEINSTATSSHVWTMYDVNGKLVMSGSESLTEGLNYFYIDATQLPAGLYMLQSTFNGTVESTRIIKQ